MDELFEALSELVLEVVFDLIDYCRAKLVQPMIPEKALTEKSRKIVKVLFTVINGVSLFALVIGILMLVSDDSCAGKRIALYTVCIASGIILLPIAAGLCVKIAKRLRK